MRTMIVTGGAGFIGCNFVRYALAHTADRIVVVDKLTYAGSLHNLEEVAQHERYQFVQMDIADLAAVENLFDKYQPDALVNFAAESHVDRSIDKPADFIETNIVGTFVLLEAALKYFRGLHGQKENDFRFLHVSTDEVYGTLGNTGKFSEESPYQPNSPYAASKAAADHLVHAYFQTYGLPVLITNCSNNFGPYQFPEKLIPLMILNAVEGKPLPIYGDGGNVRDWLFVEDHCQGVLRVLNKGKAGEKYNIGGNNERTNVQVVDALCDILQKIKPAGRNSHLLAKKIKSYQELKQLVKDRPGHDRRYAIDASKTQRELGWKASYSFQDALELTVKWYLDHLDWCEKVQAGHYQRERLGLAESKTKK